MQRDIWLPQLHDVEHADWDSVLVRPASAVLFFLLFGDTLSRLITLAPSVVPVQS